MVWSLFLPHYLMLNVENTILKVKVSAKNGQIKQNTTILVKFNTYIYVYIYVFMFTCVQA